MSSLEFKVMAFGFRVRDIFRPRIDILREAGIKEGSHVLDYGCGPGGYIPALARLVGPTGRICALDIHPAANDLSRPDDVLGELHRVLKSDGILSCSDHHMAEQEIAAAVTASSMFELAKKGKRTYSFAKVLR